MQSFMQQQAAQHFVLCQPCPVTSLLVCCCLDFALAWDAVFSISAVERGGLLVKIMVAPSIGFGRYLTLMAGAAFVMGTTGGDQERLLKAYLRQVRKLHDWH